MRKFIAIIFYIFGGMFIATTIMVATRETLFIDGSNFLVVSSIVLFLGTVFLLIGAWIHPSKEWKKHISITITSSTILMMLGNVQQYFLIKGMKDTDIDTKYTNVLKEMPLDYNWINSIMVTALLLAVSFWLYRKN